MAKIKLSGVARVRAKGRTTQGPSTPSAQTSGSANRRLLAGDMAKSTDPFRYFDSSPEVIRLVVMMYLRYPLSLRNVEDLLFERGIDICHETVRLWWNRFGPMFAGEIRRKRVQQMRAHTHWRWHLDEVYVKINGEMRYLWRAVDHEGEVLESFVTITRDKAAALNFIKKAMKRHGRPQAIVTDGLRSYGAAMKEIGNVDRQETGRWLNNRAENNHQATPRVGASRGHRGMTGARGPCRAQCNPLPGLSWVVRSFRHHSGEPAYAERLSTPADFKLRHHRARHFAAQNHSRLPMYLMRMYSLPPAGSDPYAGRNAVGSMSFVYDPPPNRERPFLVKSALS